LKPKLFISWPVFGTSGDQWTGGHTDGRVGDCAHLYIWVRAYTIFGRVCVCIYMCGCIDCVCVWKNGIVGRYTSGCLSGKLCGCVDEFIRLFQWSSLYTVEL
jgi:hypothetical protein